MTLVLWDARLYDPATGTASEHRTVTIDEDTITAIGEASGERPDGARDLAGATLLPGFIDAHAHVLSDTSRSPGFGPPPARHGEPPRPAALGHYVLAASADRWLRSGFTTLRDVGSYDDEATVLKLAIETGVVPGPRVYTCGRIVSATSPGGDIFGTMYREADGPWEMRKAVREQLRRGADFIKFMATGARSVVLEDSEPAQLTLEEMEAIVERLTAWAGAWLPTPRASRHAARAPGRRRYHRARPLAASRAAVAGRHGRTGTILVPTLSTFHDLAERFVDDFAPVLVEQAKRQLEEAMRTVARAREAGVTMALGYDSGPPGTSANELIRMQEAGLTAAEALRAATLGGAAALGREDLGRIGVGCRADVVAVDGRPDEDPTLLTRPDAIRLVVGRGVALA